MVQFKDIIVFIFIIGSAQGFLLSAFLFKKKENRSANKLLSFAMLAFAIDLAAAVIYVGEYYKIFPQTIGMTATFPYLYGPSIYLYILILGNRQEGFKKSYLLHFLPFIILNIYGIFFYYFESIEFKLSLMDFDKTVSWHLDLVGQLIPVHGCIYTVLTIWETLKFDKKLKDSYSNIVHLNLKWIIFLVSGTTVIWIIVVLAYLLNFIYGEQMQANVFIYIALSILIYSIGFKSLHQPEVLFFEKASNSDLNSKSDQAELSTYKKSGLSDTSASKYLAELLKLMEREKPFLNNKLKLIDLSQMLNISTHNLSEIINKKLNQNFYDFVNSYRVNEVKRLIEDDDEFNFSILALGYDAGFSSKSAFYSAFKKLCGVTPAQYRQENK
jgi:AraC-like DNA-binding protein